MKHAALSVMLVLLFASCLTVVSAEGSDAPLFVRTPNISQDGKQSCFEYQGDLWVTPTKGGEAKQLTIHMAD